MLDAHIVKARRQFTVDASIQVAAGESVALFGPSGAGKTTLLSCIAGIERPDAGYVRLAGRDLMQPPVPLHQRNIGYLTQRSLLFPHLTVADNVCFGLAGSNAARSAAGEVRERFGLDSIWRAPATGVSGGQAQRVALARMLVRRPQLVLLDEPFTALDRVATRELLAMLRAWQHEHRFGSIVVDHQEHVLRKLCARVYAMQGGAVVQSGTWDELHARPASAVLAQLLAPL